MSSNLMNRARGLVTPARNGTNGFLDFRDYDGAVVDTSSVISLSGAVGKAACIPDLGTRFIILPGVHAELQSHYAKQRNNGRREITDAVMDFLYRNGSLVDFDHRNPRVDAERYGAHSAHESARQQQKRRPLSETDFSIVVYAVAHPKPIAVLTEDGLIQSTVAELAQPGYRLDCLGRPTRNGYKHIRMGTYMDVLRHLER